MSIRKLFTLALFLILFGQAVQAQDLPAPSKIRSDMELANRYFMAKWPDPAKDIVTDKSRPSNLWTRATYYEGLMSLYYLNRDTALYQYAVDWGTAHQWKPTYGSLTTRDGDHQCCGQTYIELYLLDKKPERISSIKTNIDNMVKSTKIDDWSWIDAIHMSMPVFAKLGAVYNDTKYTERMYAMYNYSKTKHGAAGLYNPAEGLWWRDGNFDPPFTTPTGKMCYWSRGNGWVIAALVRVLDVLPESDVHRKEYIDDFKALANALVKIQREDGFWNPSLVDPEDFGGKESSGTAFFVYGLAWGINKGFLDKISFLPAVKKGWEGLINNALHPNGFLGWMQGTGKEPKDGQPLSYTKEPNFEDYGLGAFLLAGSEVYHLSKVLSSNKETRLDYSSQPDFFVFYHSDENQLTVHLHYKMGRKVDIDIVDCNGRIIRQLEKNILIENQQFSSSYDVNSLPNGIFLVRCRSASFQKLTKFVR